MKAKKIEVKTVPDMRDRWTVIDVEEKAIRKVRAYAQRYNMTTGGALSEIINKALD